MLHAEEATTMPGQDSLANLFSLATQYRNEGNYKKTYEIIRQTHLLRLKLYGASSIEVAKSYINLARTQQLCWEYDSALISLQKAEEIYVKEEEPDHLILGTIYSEMGNIYMEIGDYLLAEDYFSQAEDLLKHVNKEDLGRLIILYFRFADLALKLDQADRSVDYYQLAYKIIHRLGDSRNFLLNYYGGLALACTSKGDVRKGIEYEKKAIEQARQDSSTQSLNLALLYNNIGVDFHLMHDTLQARSYFERSLEILKLLDNRGKSMAELYESMGSLAYTRRNYEKALAFYQRGLLLTSPTTTLAGNIDNPESTRIEDKLTALRILKSKIRCLTMLHEESGELKYLEGAIHTGILIIDLVDYVLNSAQSYESKLQATNLEYDIYNITLDLISKAYSISSKKEYIELAFRISEKSKSAVLMASMRELGAREFGDVPDSLLKREQMLSRDISFYRYTIYEEQQNGAPDTARIAVWNNYLFEAQHEHDLIIKLFETRYPKYYKLKYDLSVIDLPELQKQLGIHDAIIQYSLSDSVLYTFCITRRNYFFHSQALKPEFSRILNEYLKIYHDFDFSKQAYSEFTLFCWLSNSMYNYLIKPVASELPDGNLIIVPDGALSFLPFETLIRDIPGGIPSGYYRDLDYLLYSHAISYSYSSSLFHDTQTQKRNGRIKKLLAFAPEYEVAASELGADLLPVARQKYRKNLFPIPGAIEEVNMLREIIPSDVYTGHAATESKFRSIADRYDILHLAMHALIDNNDPFFSKLIFTLPDDSTNDGVLNTFEIYGLKLKARMVVLSACNTAEGEYKRGEGVLSLARGFVYAGTPSLVMTMWEVEDKSGTALMKEFYEDIRNGYSKPEALQKAKLEFIRNARPENAHPFFWSSFVVLNNTRPLYIKPVLHLIWIIPLLLLPVFFLTRRRKHRS